MEKTLKELSSEYGITRQALQKRMQICNLTANEDFKTVSGRIIVLDSGQDKLKAYSDGRVYTVAPAIDERGEHIKALERQIEDLQKRLDDASGKLDRSQESVKSALDTASGERARAEQAELLVRSLMQKNDDLQKRVLELEERTSATEEKTDGTIVDMPNNAQEGPKTAPEVSAEQVRTETAEEPAATAAPAQTKRKLTFWERVSGWITQ